MAQLVQSIRIELDDEISSGIKRVSRNLKSMKGNVDRAAKSFKKMGKAASDAGKGLSLRLSAPIAAAGTFMVKAASDAEETANKFNVVFKDVSDASKVAAQNLADNYGLSNQASQELLSNTGDLLTGFGLSGAEALSLSEKVNTLAADLGSFNNLPTEQASKALTSALLGEREAIKSLGIVINEEMVKNMVEAMDKAGKFTDETMQQKKAIATLKLAMMQSGNAIGDYARSSDSLANQSRELLADLKDLADSFGRVLIPVVKDVIKSVRPFFDRLKELSPEMKKTIVVIAAMAAAIGPLLIIFGQMAIGIGALIPIITSLGSVFAGAATIFGTVAAVLSGPVIAAIAAVGAIGFVIMENWEEVKLFFTALGEFFVATFRYIDQFMQGFLGFSPIEQVQASWQPVKDFFIQLWQEIVIAFDNAMAWIGKTITKVTDKIKGVTDKIKAVTGGAKAIGEKARGFLNKLIGPAIDTLEPTLASSISPSRENSIAAQSPSLSNSNKVVVNLRVDKDKNPVLDSAESDKGLSSLAVNMGDMVPS